MSAEFAFGETGGSLLIWREGSHHRRRRHVVGVGLASDASKYVWVLGAQRYAEALAGVGVRGRAGACAHVIIMVVIMTTNHNNILYTIRI